MKPMVMLKAPLLLSAALATLSMCGCAGSEAEKVSGDAGSSLDGRAIGSPADTNMTQPGMDGASSPVPSPRPATMDGASSPAPSPRPGTADVVIDGVYFAQTHVLAPDDPNFKLVSNRDALIKVHVISPTASPAPEVSAMLSQGGKTLKVILKGPSQLPTSIPSGKGVIQHRFEDSFTASIPAIWVQPGLSIVVNAGAANLMVSGLKIGAPTRVILTMFDMNFFSLTAGGDYPAGWKEEIEAKWPVTAIELRRTLKVVFPQVVMAPHPNIPSTLVSSKQDYMVQTGMPFDGEQDAASQWVGALKAAAGTAGRVSLYYMNIYGVFAGGQAGGFGGVGNGGSPGIVHHELGHALSLPHWGDSPKYPYKGDMFGIKAPAIYNGTHAGPTWAFDPMKGRFLPPTVQDGAATGVPGTYKADPMQGGGVGDQEKGYIFRHFSDFSVNQMRNYLEGHVVVWNEALKSYASWNDAEGAYTKVVANNGVQFAVERDVSVISVMVAVSGVTPKVDLIYPPIGPYVAGLITLFDPTVAADRTSADNIYCPTDGCDVSLRIVQGGQTKVYMLPIVVNPAANPFAPASLATRALNLPAKDGAVTSVELLSTPDVEKAGLPASPSVLATWKP